MNSKSWALDEVRMGGVEMKIAFTVVVVFFFKKKTIDVRERV